MLNRKHGQAILAGFVLVIVMVFYAQAQDDNIVYLPAVVGPEAATPTATFTPTPTQTPTPTPTQTPTPTPTSTSASVWVVSSQGYRSGSTYYVVGEVINTSSIPVSGVLISARYYDAADQLVAVSEADTFLRTTDVGQRNPFMIFLSNAPAGIVRYTLSLKWSTGISHLPITVLSSQTRDNSGVEVFGEVRNDQAQRMSFVKIVATFYDIEGNVVRADYSFISSFSLEPGESSVYRIRMSEDFLFTTYTVQAEGSRGDNARLQLSVPDAATGTSGG